MILGLLSLLLFAFLSRPLLSRPSSHGYCCSKKAIVACFWRSLLGRFALLLAFFFTPLLLLAQREAACITAWEGGKHCLGETKSFLLFSLLFALHGIAYFRWWL